jgi:mannose-6-phosphate isomerase-like protein (cupin superfamily)
MGYLLGLIIFICVLFIYIHINHQFKRSEDLEIYEMDYNTNAQLQDICDVKQPVLFQFEPIVPSVFENIDLPTLSKQYGEEIMNVKDTNDYAKSTGELSVQSIPIKCSNVNKVFLNDASSHYYTENNDWFLEETEIVSKIRPVDEYLKPRFTVQTKYDYISGSNNTCTPLRYHLNYREYYIVTSGKIRVKMTPWKNSKYLHPIKDYDNYEFRSTFNTWVAPTPEMEKVRFLEFTVEKGNVLYIPSYWWYSIQFTDNTSLYAITYNSIMNIVAYTPQWILYFLQQQNTQTKTVKTIELSVDTPESSYNDKSSTENLPSPTLVPRSGDVLKEPVNDNKRERNEPLTIHAL